MTLLRQGLGLRAPLAVRPNSAAFSDIRVLTGGYTSARTLGGDMDTVTGADYSAEANGPMGLLSRDMVLPSGEHLMGCCPGDNTYLGDGTTMQFVPHAKEWRLFRKGKEFWGATPLMAWREQPGHEADEWWV